MTFFERIKSKKNINKKNEQSQKNSTKNEDYRIHHPLHEEGVAFRYAYSAMVAMAAESDTKINSMEVKLLTKLMESINLDGGIKEVLMHLNSQDEHILVSLSVMITSDRHKELLFADMIIMCLADSYNLSLNEDLFIEKMWKLLNLPSLQAELLKKYVELRMKCQLTEAETMLEQMPQLKSFAEHANEYLTFMVLHTDIPQTEPASAKGKSHLSHDQRWTFNQSNKATGNRVLGIDFGTNYCCMAVIEDHEAVVIPNQEGYFRTPSVVAFKSDGSYMVGDAAKPMALIEPERAITSIKRQLLKETAFKVGSKQYSSCEIAAMILHKLKTDAATYLQQPIEEVVIAVPAYFSEKLKLVIKNAGSIAGLKVLGVINEATAAALGYGLNQGEESQKVLIFDLGGGTYDVSVLEIGDGVFEVLSINGNGHLGGEDFDEALVDHFMDEFIKVEGVDIKHNKVACARLKAAAEQAKIDLTSAQKATIHLPYFTYRGEQPVHFKGEITRSKFDTLTKHLVDRTIELMKNALNDAMLKNQDIDKVILVGGSTRNPAVQEAVKRVIGKEPFRGVNPDEAVASGAAIQSAIITGAIRETLLLDVIPMSLGVETQGGVFTQIIKRNTTIPSRMCHVFTTTQDNQPSIDIHILQGERPMASENISLGYLKLSSIPPAPKGVPQIEVIFDINSYGLINVSAKDLGTGKTSNVSLHSDVVMSLKDIAKCQRNVFGS